MEKKQFKAILLIVTYAIALYFASTNLDLIGGILERALQVLMPFIIGACVAFILSIPMNFFEEKVYRFGGTGKRQMLRRILSLTTTVLVVLLGGFIVVFLIVPEFQTTFTRIAETVPIFFNEVYQYANSLDFDWALLEEWIQNIDFDIANIAQHAYTWIQGWAGTALGGAVSAISSVSQGVVSTVIGIIFAFYLLFVKETVSSQVKKVLYALCKTATADFLTDTAKLTHQTFSRFFTGQCLEAVILGVLFYIAMLIFQMPYAIVISVLIMITALIPIFGAFIGCIVGAFLILMVDPLQAFWFIVLFLVLQQVEGNFIYPHVVGNSVGLPPFLVLISVTLGGSLFGVMGMLVFIPLISVIYVLIGTWANKRVVKKGIDQEKFIAKHPPVLPWKKEKLAKKPKG